jgi:hypothetical protein
MSKNTYNIRDSLDQLNRDTWRDAHPFSDDIVEVHKVLFEPYASDYAKEQAIQGWLQKKGSQPCLFGRIAAAQKTLEYCFLEEADLRRSDQHVREKLHRSLLEWKRRGLDPAWSHPAHGFMVCVVSEKVAFAAPDSNLLTFAQNIRDLWGLIVEPDIKSGENNFMRETLYLRHPRDGTYVRFTFTVDYFAAQGDHRWWHDHRVPGGIAFTANSVGHMICFREWYEEKQKQTEWLASTAMLTIDSAADVPTYGAASRLESLVYQKPYHELVACPFLETDKRLAEKDWTRYSGWHHSDHNIRKEFFEAGYPDPADIPDRVKARGRWHQDFAYLIDNNAFEHQRFVNGESCTREEVEQKLGKREEWSTLMELKPKKALRDGDINMREDELVQAADKIHESLKKMESWRLSAADLLAIVG